MARRGPSYRYWDSCAFLGWPKKEEDKKEGCGAVIRAAQAGELILVTSTLTIAEVLHTKGKDRIPASSQEAVERFFKHNWVATEVSTEPRPSLLGVWCGLTTSNLKTLCMSRRR
jgi:hypothetical protein